MSYIVFDLEWNQPMCAAQPKKGRNGVQLAGEIIQIGAVRLTPDGRPGEQFSMCVRPRFYKRLNKRVQELTGITKEQLSEAADFSEAGARFAAFCGKDAVLLTWGFDDVPILRQNLIAWDMDVTICEHFYNLQTIFNQQTDGGKEQRSLAFALEYFGIIPALEAHNALHDAYHTALVCAHLDLAAGIAAYGGGSAGALWEHPLLEESFAPYKSKRAAFSDEQVARMRCPLCRRTIETTKWVPKGGGYYIALGHCEACGDFLGRIKFTAVSKDVFSLVRTCFQGSKYASEHYNTLLEKAEERKAAFKERMHRQKNAGIPRKRQQKICAQTKPKRPLHQTVIRTQKSKKTAPDRNPTIRRCKICRKIKGFTAKKLKAPRSFTFGFLSPARRNHRKFHAG